METIHSLAPEPTSKEKKNRTVMGILAYLGILVVISYLVAKDDPFVKFHIKQGLVLFVIEILVNIATAVTPILWPILGIVNFGIVVLIIIGIVNVSHNEQKELPLVGQFAKEFTF